MFLWTDWILITIIIISSLLSFRNGFFRELFSFIALLIAFYVALTHNEIISIQFNKIFGGNFLTPGYAMAGSFFIIMFIATKLIQRIRRKFKLYNVGKADRLLGMIFGFSRGVIVAALILAFSLFSIFTKTESWKTTLVTNLLQPLSNYFTEHVIPKKALDFIAEQLRAVDHQYTFQKAKNILNTSLGADFKINKQILKLGEQLELQAQKNKEAKNDAESSENKKPIERIFQKPSVEPQGLAQPSKLKSDREVLLEKQKAKDKAAQPDKAAE